jgi:hypothetical protein
MAYPYTRAQLRQRVLIESHSKSDSGAFATDRVNAVLQYALAHTWETLTATDQAFGERLLEKTVDASNTDGWTPGATEIELPADFRRVEVLRRGQGFPDLVTPRQSLWSDVATGIGWYYVNGPSQDTDPGGDLVVAPQKLMVRPALVAGEVWKMLYVQQPPSLGDPEDTEDDTITVDLVGDGIARIVIARAIVLLQARDDVAGQNRAAAEYALARTEYDNARLQRAGGIETWNRRGIRGGR